MLENLLAKRTRRVHTLNNNIYIYIDIKQSYTLTHTHTQDTHGNSHENSKCSMHGGLNVHEACAFSIAIQCAMYGTYSIHIFFSTHISACVRRCWWWKLMPFVSIVSVCALRCYCYYYIQKKFVSFSLFVCSFVRSFDRLVCFLFGWFLFLVSTLSRYTELQRLFSAHDGSAAEQTDIIETHHAK